MANGDLSPWGLPFVDKRFVRRLMGSAGREQLGPGGVGPFHQFRLLVEFARFFRVACCLPPLVEPLFGGRQSDSMCEQRRSSHNVGSIGRRMGYQACSAVSLLEKPTQSLLYPDSDNAIISDALSAVADGLPLMHGSSLVAACSHDEPSPMHPVPPMRRAWTGWECPFARHEPSCPSPGL